MIRKEGYGAKGKKLLYRGEFGRSIRSSCLCFVGVEGVLNVYVEFCRRFSLDRQSKVEQYPGKHSVWIMDGAKIHCNDNFVYYLRSLGILTISLPAYCPVFNSIEFVFGMVKKKLQKLNNNETKMDVGKILCKVFNMFLKYDMTKLFQNCGYLASGQFDPSNAVGDDLTKDGFGK